MTSSLLYRLGRRADGRAVHDRLPAPRTEIELFVHGMLGRDRGKAAGHAPAGPDLTRRQTHVLVKEDERRSSGERAMQHIPDADRGERSLQPGRREPLVEQIGHRHGNGAQHLDHLPATKPAEPPA